MLRQTRSRSFDDMRKLIGVDVEDDKPSGSHLVIAEQMGLGVVIFSPRHHAKADIDPLSTRSDARQAGQL
jgi:hypothetical protein